MFQLKTSLDGYMKRHGRPFAVCTYPMDLHIKIDQTRECCFSLHVLRPTCMILTFNGV